jgi:hypothetical protein
MANVVCAICGDKGHIAADCLQAKEKHQRENVDWKEAAEKKYTMDAEYIKMMNELGIEPKGFDPPPFGGTSAAAAEAPEVSPPQTEIASQLSVPQTPFGARPPPPQLGAPAMAFAKSSIIPRPQVQAPQRPWAQARPQQMPLQTHLRPNVHPQMVNQSMWQPSGGALPSNGLPPRPSLVRGAPDVDDSVLCPLELSALAATVVAEMSRETGARIIIDSSNAEPGGQRLLIQGQPHVRERAKLHFRAWLNVQTGMAAPGMSPGTSPDMGFPPEGFPPSGFPPGMPSVPDGFPPSGFPPGMAPATGMPPVGHPPGLPMQQTSFLPSTAPAVIDLEDPASAVIAPPGMPEGFGVTWDEL